MAEPGYGVRMRLPSVPGPRDVWQLFERSADAVEQLLDAVPRALVLVAQAEALVTRSSGLVGDIEMTRASAQAVVDRTDAVVDRADTLLASLVPLNERLVELLDTIEPPLTQLQPALKRLAETTTPREVDALVHLVDQLPALADNVVSVIVPILDSMGSVAPDLHDLLDVSRELNEMLSQIPGISRMKRRIDKEQAEDAAEEEEAERRG